MFTTVISALVCVAEAPTPATAPVAPGAIPVALGAAARVLDAEGADTRDPKESTEPVLRWLEGTGFAGGKSNCEIAIAISERKSARKKRLSILWNWIVSAWAERMATQDPGHRQVHASKDTVSLKGFDCVC